MRQEIMVTKSKEISSTDIVIQATNLVLKMIISLLVNSQHSRLQNKWFQIRRKRVRPSSKIKKMIHGKRSSQKYKKAIKGG